MSTRMDEFREFVSRYPLVREDVTSGKKTWQNIYEDWVILGENNSIWDKYKEGKKETIDLLSSENLRNIMNYVKKINPDSISKTLNTVQKILQITEGIGGKGRTGFFNGNYNSWWD
jgi:hypothetical protein